MKNKMMLRQSNYADVEPIADLRAVVLRDDLIRLGRYDEMKVRQRFRDAFDSAYTWIIEIDASFAGCVAFKPTIEGYLLEHFYIHPDYQGRGIGSQVLTKLNEQDDVGGKSESLNVKMK